MRITFSRAWATAHSFRIQSKRSHWTSAIQRDSTNQHRMANGHDHVRHCRRHTPTTAQQNMVHSTNDKRTEHWICQRIRRRPKAAKQRNQSMMIFIFWWVCSHSWMNWRWHRNWDFVWKFRNLSSKNCTDVQIRRLRKKSETKWQKEISFCLLFLIQFIFHCIFFFLLFSIHSQNSFFMRCLHNPCD